MELFIITLLHLLMEVQSYKVPNLKVSPDVIRESNSVHLICESPADVKVNQCYFYSNKEENTKLSQSCQLHLTGTELLLWTREKSPVSLNIRCFYTIDVYGVHKPSPYSPPVTLTILDTLKKPSISVNGTIANISISCEIPLTVKAEFICNLYTEYGPLTRRSYLSRTQTGGHQCMFYMSLSEIFKHNQTVNSRQLSCDYSVKTDPENEMNLTSPRSDVFTVSGYPQAKLSVSSSVIMDSDTVQLDCNSKNQHMDECYFTIDGRENKQSRSCQLSLTGSDIMKWSGGQRSSVILTCFYTMYISQNDTMPSPCSDPVTVTVQRKRMWLIMLSAVACSVIVLTGLICLCGFACKTVRSKRQRTAGDSRASGPADICSFINYEPDTSKPTDLKQQQSHQESKPETYSLITSAVQPSDVLVNTRHKKGHTEEDEIVYHVYCTIPDKPVKAVEDHIYSLAT
nr:uncharacterized protein LOC129427909 [Misgurnus anguillicaudatus]